MSWLSDRIEGAGRALSGLGKSMGGVVGGVVGWAGKVLTGDVGAQPVPVPEFVAKVHAGSSSPWHEAAGQAEQAAKGQGEHAASLQAIITGLESSWSGTGADAARERIHKLYAVADSADRSMARNQQSVLTAASGFEYTQATLQKMPPRPDKSFGDVISPWDTDTEKAIKKYNEKADFNLAVYKGYESQLKQTQGGLQGDYGQLGFYDGADITLVPPPKGRVTPPPERPVSGRGDVEHGGNAGNSGFTPSPTPGHTPGQVTPGSGPQVGGDHTSTSGYHPAARDGLSGPNIPTPSSGPSIGRGETGTGIGSGVLPGAPGFTGGPGGRAGGVGGVPGAGRGSGAGVLGGAGGAESGRAGSRLTGAPGAPGGAMAPGARGGKSEDTEYARKYGLDEAPVEVADIDPETGYTVVPPTIGAD